MKLYNNILSDRYIYHGTLNKEHPYNSIITKIIELLKNSNSRKFRNFCPLCDSSAAYKISEKDRYNLPVTFLICSKCGFIFSQEYFSDDFLLLYYKSIYNNFKNKTETEDELFLSRTKPDSPSFQRYEFIKRALGKKIEEIEVIMEPGCNDGCNLNPFLKNGKKVYGCDFDENRISVGKKNGINILVGDVEKLLEINKKADLVILSHVLAHVTDLNKFLVGVKKLLKPNGFIFVETPGFRGWWDKIKIFKNYRKNFLDFIQFEFCYIFDLKLLEILLGKYNFKLYKGNEYIRSIFCLDVNSNQNMKSAFRDNSKEIGKSNLNYLLNIEKNFLKFLFLKRKFLK